jgi:hypothetical protein
VSKRDKITVLCSIFLLLATLAAGAFGLFRAYQYNDAPSRPKLGLNNRQISLLPIAMVGAPGREPGVR